MSVERLDFLFPFFVLGYGAIVTVVLHMPIMARAEELLPPDWVGQLRAHRWLAFGCLIVGGLWSLQNIWL